jgi:hypothetical protein
MLISVIEFFFLFQLYSISHSTSLSFLISLITVFSHQTITIINTATPPSYSFDPQWAVWWWCCCVDNGDGGVAVLMMVMV